jgi:hypothetical protein
VGNFGDPQQQVEGVGGAGTLSGILSLLGNSDAFCAVLTTGGVDCWGYGYYGQLGNGTLYTTGNEGSATPVQVEGGGGGGTLAGVASLTNNGDDNYCVLLKTDGVDCWWYGTTGQLGDGAFVNKAIPVSVEGIGGTGTLPGSEASPAAATGIVRCSPLAKSIAGATATTESWVAGHSPKVIRQCQSKVLEEVGRSPRWRAWSAAETITAHFSPRAQWTAGG